MRENSISGAKSNLIVDIPDIEQGPFIIVGIYLRIPSAITERLHHIHQLNGGVQRIPFQRIQSIVAVNIHRPSFPGQVIQSDGKCGGHAATYGSASPQ
ncbi:MAG: hypothetical protein U0176_06420 [Bacteroidia bacterium]